MCKVGVAGVKAENSKHLRLKSGVGGLGVGGVGEWGVVRTGGLNFACSHIWWRRAVCFLNGWMFRPYSWPIRSQFGRELVSSEFRKGLEKQ